MEITRQCRGIRLRIWRCSSAGWRKVRHCLTNLARSAVREFGSRYLPNCRDSSAPASAPSEKWGRRSHNSKLRCFVQFFGRRPLDAVDRIGDVKNPDGVWKIPQALSAKLLRCNVKSAKTRAVALRSRDYDAMLNRVAALIDEARRASARAVNTLMTATYWSIGRHIVEFELSGKKRAEYGEELLVSMAADLTSRFGRVFSRQNLQQMRQFYQARFHLNKATECRAPYALARAENHECCEWCRRCNCGYREKFARSWSISSQNKPCSTEFPDTKAFRAGMVGFRRRFIGFSRSLSYLSTIR